MMVNSGIIKVAHSHGFIEFSKLDEAVAHPKTDRRRTGWISSQSLLVIGQCTAEVFLVEGDTRLAKQ